jgi:hypothetical protein
MGSNTIEITAADPDYSNTDSIIVIREPETTPPTVGATIPADQATGIAVNLPVTVTFSEEMNSSTINVETFLLTDGSGEVNGSVTYTDQTATFVPDTTLVYETLYTARVTTGVTDLSGNAMAEEYSWSFTTGDTPDTTPPTVTSVYPTNGTQCVAIGSTLQAYFDEPMLPATINGETVTLTDMNRTEQKYGFIEYSDTDLKVSFNPYTDLALNTSYRATIKSGASDLAGNPMTADYSWTFSTPGGGSGDWYSTSTLNVPSARWLHTAVWTGTEMIVWGGYKEGAVYVPNTDSWRLSSVSDVRRKHTAVWTGSEMIVWGGEDINGTLGTGGRYTPSTDGWTATSSVNAPTPRQSHTGVWTGSEMIVWGGSTSGEPTDTGARYHPETDSWQPLSKTGAPTARYLHSAVWTGSEMIVWGGLTSGGQISNTGARYNPATDSWQPLSTDGAPDARYLHSAVWTGSEMIVYGGVKGYPLNTGGAYNPGTDSWHPMSTDCAPSSRYEHTAVWTGSRMLVFGGRDTNNMGAAYDPVTDSWLMLPIYNAPAGRSNHSAIWTGNEMIIWGGGLTTGGTTNTGGRYTP